MAEVFISYSRKDSAFARLYSFLFDPRNEYLLILTTENISISDPRRLYSTG